MFWLVVHPASVLMIAVAVNTYILFPEESPMELVRRIWQVSEKAVIYSITDSMIYGNWLYTVVTSVFIPNWFCFWIITFSEGKSNKQIKEKNE